MGTWLQALSECIPSWCTAGLPELAKQDANETSVEFVVMAPENTAGIASYNISVVPSEGDGKGDRIAGTCELKTPEDVRGGANCRVNGLLPYTRYNVSVQACDAEKSICSAVTTTQVRTTQTRKCSCGGEWAFESVL